MLAVGAYAVIGGTLSLGTMRAVSMRATSLFGPLERLVPSLMQIVAIRIYTDRIDEVRQAKPEQDPEVALDAPVLAGGVSLRNVSLRYGDGPLVVDDVTLDVAPGSSEGGASLSGGQRQRIALARAVLREPSVRLIAADRG